jgi:ATP-binding cassette subfamily C (CFTR/MRP) protein 1
LSVHELCGSYSIGDADVLKDVCFELHRGEFVGLCGRTGCGKSTLSLALVGGLKSVRGSVQLNRDICGDDASMTTLGRLRYSVQLFPQDCYILSGSVREVLDPYGKHNDVKLNELLKELWYAVSEGVYDGTGLSLETVLGQGGSNLSAGQRQLMVFVRAALSEARVVILDELFSCLDMHAAARALKVIMRELLDRGVCVVLIAHTLQDIALCDNIWVMESGHIVERGHPEKLLDGAGGGTRFYRMVLDMGGDAQVEHIRDLIKVRKSF